MSTFHTPRFVMISLLQHLTGEARCLTDDEPRDASLEEARRGEARRGRKTKRKQNAERLGRKRTTQPCSHTHSCSPSSSTTTTTSVMLCRSRPHAMPAQPGSAQTLCSLQAGLWQGRLGTICCTLQATLPQINPEPASPAVHILTPA